ncbi:MAG TPA: phosphate acyltransferase PlsX [Candidatus Dormibacteraeota bacterium]|jgi:glycerol-3-phosphate acyltransferase PlsX|nr:phosphate acyltransferase PlsX [Candidatus Dormibacteraeota bacterium]
MRIAVDVMGGDHGCRVVIAGAKLALEANKKITALYLVGDQAAIHAALPPRGFRDHRVRVIHTSEVVTMDDKPVVALRKKKDSSIARAAELVRDGEADAVVSLGNTGGIFAAATFKVGRISGVDRGCIATVIPRQGNEFVLLDAGANIECKPFHLAQFAVMGNIYSREVLGRKKPRVGILSIGTEDSKGNELTLEAFKLCKHLDLNFIGNVEGHDLFKDHVDVVVCDGFVGNIVLKTSESLAIAMFSMLKRELMSNAKRQIGAYLAKDAFHAIRRRMDPEVYGGAPLLGFNGMVFKAHASARERAIASALRVTGEALQHEVNHIIAREIARANEKLDGGDGSNCTVPA